MSDASEVDCVWCGRSVPAADVISHITTKRPICGECFTLVGEVLGAAAEVGAKEILKAWADASGGGRVCMWCGHVDPVFASTEERTAASRKHLAECAEHPMRALLVAAKRSLHTLSAWEDEQADKMLRAAIAKAEGTS